MKRFSSDLQEPREASESDCEVWEHPEAAAAAAQHLEKQDGGWLSQRKVIRADHHIVFMHECEIQTPQLP